MSITIGQKHDSWPPEKEAQLRQLWNSGYTARKMSELLGGYSRNAIIGKARRLGLSYSRGRGNGIQDGRAAAKRAAERAAKLERQAARLARVIVVRKRQINKPLPLPAPVALPYLAIPFAERTAFQCSYIKGEPDMEAKCCGQPTIAGSAWCRWHWDIVYAPLPPRKR